MTTLHVLVYVHSWKPLEAKASTDLQFYFSTHPPVITPCLLLTLDPHYGPLWPQSQLRGQRG